MGAQRDAVGRGATRARGRAKGGAFRRARGVAALAGAAFLLAAPGAARAEDLGAVAADAGWSGASAFSTLLYAPCKMAFAIGGGFVGGLTWLFSGGDTSAAMAVWVPTASGDYLVTRDHLQGRRALRFLGPGPEVHDANVAAGRRSER